MQPNDPASAQAQLSGHEQVRPLNYEKDIQWAADVTSHAYGSLIEDWEGFAKWCAAAFVNKALHCVRTDDAFMVAAIQQFFYKPAKPRLTIVHFASSKPQPWQMMALLRSCVDWGKEKGCVDMQIADLIAKDAAPFARRFGPVSQHNLYIVEIQ